ncbi:hypothetical protein [Rhizobium sp.]|uniref:hypothetical protein n=1 Tax=Rhizobium sp. TaxID=391 RepID=UPI0034C68C40
MRDLIETIDPWLGFSELVQDRDHQREEVEVDAYGPSRGFNARVSSRTGLPPARRKPIRKKTGKTISKPATGI